MSSKDPVSLLLFYFAVIKELSADNPGRETYLWNILQRKAQEVRVAQAFELFRENKIEPILIKGWAAARNYPETKIRYSIDMDLAVSRDEYKKTVDLCSSPEAEGMAIDLHCELRHLDTVEWNDLFDNSLLIDAGHQKIRVLRPEDHLRVLCVHWLTDGGVHRDRLWDIYYGLEKYRENFDWDRFLNKVDEKRRRWLICTLGLTVKFLGLDLRGTPIQDAGSGIPDWIVRTVEDEWTAETQHWPLESSLHSPVLFAKQLRKRMRPNPIWATVNVNGSFDARTRFFYQLANFGLRIIPSVKRITRLAYRTAQKRV